MKRATNVRHFILAFAALAWPALAPAKPLDAAAVDALARDALKAFRAPGVAVVVVHENDVYLKGYGVRELGDDRPVTADTVFGIGSCTKAFTTTAMAILIDDGKMAWDDPVRDHVPYFRLADPLADRAVTLRDLVCHRTGLARHDLLWYRAPWPIEETIRKIGRVELTHSFRATYEYNNIMYLVAGQAVGAASKGTWQDFVQKRLLDPLDMKTAVFTRAQVLKLPDHASLHLRRGVDQFEVIPWYDDDNQVRASGSLKASARDLSKWLRFHLDGGTAGGKRLVSVENLRETYAPQVVRRVTRAMAQEMGTTQASYGLGWSVQDYRGHLLVEHGGSVDGFRAHVTMVPKAKLAVAVLTNLGGTDLPTALAHSLVDQALGLAKKDWNAFYLKQAEQAESARLARDKDREAKQHKDTKPSHELSAYVGEYEDPAYGKAALALEKGGLVLKWSSFTARLEHYHYDTFTARGPERLDKEQVMFALGADGEPASFRFLGREFKRVKAK